MNHLPNTVVFFLDQSGSISSAQHEMAVKFILHQRMTHYADYEAVLCPIEYKMRNQEVLNLDMVTVERIRKDGLQRVGQGGTELATSIQEGLKLPSIQARAVSHVVVVTDGLDNPPQKSELNLPVPEPHFSYAVLPDMEAHNSNQECYALFLKNLDHGMNGPINAQLEVNFDTSAENLGFQKKPLYEIQTIRKRARP